MKLPGALHQALQEVTRGKPFPWVWLATSDPRQGARVRTVRILSYNLLQGSLVFASHARHAKHAQIGADPRGQLCLVCQEPVLQVRLDVLLSSTPGPHHPLGERLWQKISGPDRQSLYGAHPQAPLPPAAFQLVECVVQAAEVLELRPEQRRRYRFQHEGGEWRVSELPL